MAVIRTVLGDIAPQDAGVTLTHEHIRYAYQGCEFDHNNVWHLDEVADDVGRRIHGMVKEYGVKTMVDLTPPDIGRHPELLAEVSRRSGAHIIATTGFYAERMGIGFYWRRKSVEYIADMLCRALTQGMVHDNRLTPAKAGALKVTTGGMGETPAQANGKRITPLDDRMLNAAGKPHNKTAPPLGPPTPPPASAP